MTRPRSIGTLVQLAVRRLLSDQPGEGVDLRPLDIDEEEIRRGSADWSRAQLVKGDDRTSPGKLVDRDIGRDDLRAFRDEGLGDRAADTLAGGGDQREFFPSVDQPSPSPCHSARREAAIPESRYILIARLVISAASASRAPECRT